MGHLINPSSMRLGSLNYWKDLVYINKLYYPEYLHMIFKMRLFLISFFTFRIFELNEIIYSHFNFMRQNKNLIVKIYLYKTRHVTANFKHFKYAYLLSIKEI